MTNNPTDLTSMTIVSLAELIEQRKVSPVEVSQAYLDRIEQLNDRINAYISVYPELAIEAAQKAEAEIMRGEKRGPLHGVPLAIKDLFQVSGMRRTCGSKLLDEPIATEDATSVVRLREAGAIILGMLNLHEFAFGPTGINPHYGSARNPWDLTRACGGSSAGSGAAVAAFLAAGALGTDTGGSIRIPASLCGVVGLKQTYGLASRHGIFPLSDSFDHGGPLGRTVDDTALLLQAIAGPDVHDSSTANAKVKNYTAKLDHPIDGMKIGVPRGFFFEDLHPEIETTVNAALQKLEELGAHVEDVELPSAREMSDAWGAIAAVEAYAVHEEPLRDDGSMLGTDVRERLLLGRDISTDDIMMAQKTRTRIRREMAALLRNHPILVVPSTIIPGVSIDSASYLLNGRKIEGPKVLARLTRPAALLGQPAISVPAGFTDECLPIGLQLMGVWFDEPTLLQVAHAYEQATDWHLRRPPYA